jgi:16S rRNA (cytosine1402-N4)-methyltransferase
VTHDATADAGHLPVLVEPVLRLLDPRPGQAVLDCTVGRGGHAAAILPRLAPGGRYIGLDVDAGNLAFARRRLADPPVPLHLLHRNFAQARAALDELAVPGVDLLLADFGFSSNQMTDPARGFSFQSDGPLDMRLDPTAPTTALDLVASLPERELADLIYQYGEERASRRIARKIVEARRESPITTTALRADVVRHALGVRPPKKSDGGRPRRWQKHGRIDPATRTFMALRIAVNDELGVIERLLADLPLLLARGGRAALISFHSLEDRLVKHAFLALEKSGRGERVTNKPVVAGDEEVAGNPRSRSAKLRVLQLT